MRKYIGKEKEAAHQATDNLRKNIGKEKEAARRLLIRLQVT
jgi:hypothetical protein